LAESTANGAAVGSLVDASAVAAFLGVDRSYVYEHAAELGARRLGSGPRARLRFSLEDVNRAVSCFATRESWEARTPVVEPKRRRRKTGGLGSDVELLPIRGVRSAS
jgi:hypothetical protein